QLDTTIGCTKMSVIGATLGSGAVFVLDESRDLVDVNLQITKFFEHESCGKCTPCREGTMRMRELVEKVNSGQGEASDLDLITKLARVMSTASLCGLGQTATAPVTSTLRHFSAEYAAKLKE
ncbi:MAG: NADH-quinone oxidoreductase subunit F, partial [Clostridiales bacterium]|nr:NADH-quinone oxidoreductase subunit F [Clostridiales bacterium]